MSIADDMSAERDKSIEGTTGALAELPDIADQPLDLTKEQKLRSASLIMAIRYHVDTIIKDARYLELMMQREKEAKFSNDEEEKALWHLRPTTVAAVIHIANEFEQYLLGNRPGLQVTVVPPGRAQGEV